MLASGIPTKIPVPFASSAAGGFIRPIPIPSQIGILNGAASFTDGFPPVCFTPVGAGGTPPSGQDFNGILNVITQWVQWYNAQGPISYDAAFATAVGGYPRGTILASTTFGNYYLNTVDNNTSNPDTGGAGWLLTTSGTATTGDEKFRPTSETLSGWIKENGTTIGDASSNATQLADPATFALFAWYWTNFSNTQCPTLTSLGVPVGRGASAAADYAAHRQITVLDKRGYGNLGLGDMGSTNSNRLAAMPFIIGNATTPGSQGGEATHTLTVGEQAAITPTGSIITTITDTRAWAAKGNASATGSQSDTCTYSASGVGANFTVSVAAISGAISGSSTFTGNSAGGGAAHNNIQLSILGTWYRKL